MNKEKLSFSIQIKASGEIEITNLSSLTINLDDLCLEVNYEVSPELESMFQETAREFLKLLLSKVK